MESDKRLEVWAGVECTVNRVGHRYSDQLERSGHARRPEDLDRFVALGVRTFRYPVLWERVAPEGIARADWGWTDERLGRLRELGAEPIAGLLHHGSGPRYTSLVDREFPEKFAEYAAAVAERYPWLRSYTPINEPSTTARFSGLYGLWYPHGRCVETFLRALWNQVRATGLAMRAIRRVTPEARLVQTEDLGTIYSTRGLRYQARFENERRWLTWDLLFGRVTAAHPLRRYLEAGGLSSRELDLLVAEPCPVDIVGINRYVTSDRFLDHRVRRYPPENVGGNGRHRYADVEAVRVPDVTVPGLAKLLRLTGERYGVPVAVTEAHLGCTREEQLRWLKEVWDSAHAALRSGTDVRAVTVWSLLGSFDWDTLVTQEHGTYEPGVFDVRGGEPRETALAPMVRALAAGSPFEHPSLDSTGWWKKPQRWTYRRRGPGAGPRPAPFESRRRDIVVITGATGTLGYAFARACEARGVAFALLSRRHMDIADRASVRRALGDVAPWAVVNAAGYARVDEAELDRERCWRENVTGAVTLAGECAERHAAFLTFSSDLVFDGSRGQPYEESSAVAPLNVYGASKAEAETRVLETHPSALVVRTSAFFGPWDRHNFVTTSLASFGAGETVRAPGDCVVSPTYVPDLVQACLDLLFDGERGRWHLANAGAVSWAELARRAAARAGLGDARVEECSRERLGRRAQLPAYSVLGSERAVLLPPLDDALGRYFSETSRRH